MGHCHLGGKTLLYLIDGLYAVQDQNSWIDKSQRWQSMPFNNGWTSSIFASLDGVAIDSVAVDFLRTEPTLKNVYGTVDNYLHEAALAGNPPSGVRYQVNDGDRTMEGLGVHEHWNNSVERQYSRNLGRSEGIELIQLTPDTPMGVGSNEHPSSFVTVSAFPNPFNPETNIALNLTSACNGSLNVYDATGRLVCSLKNGLFDQGIQSFRWDGKNNSGKRVSSGVYFVRFMTNHIRTATKVTLLR
jgi:hypothetical protein